MNYHAFGNTTSTTTMFVTRSADLDELLILFSLFSLLKVNANCHCNQIHTLFFDHFKRLETMHKKHYGTA